MSRSDLELPRLGADDALDRGGEEIEWTWFYLWHHEGRRARHGASMMAPDYAHWHGMYEVAERFYVEMIPQVREILEHGREAGNIAGASAAAAVLDEILARPEHKWSVNQPAAHTTAKPSAADTSPTPAPPAENVERTVGGREGDER